MVQSFKDYIDNQEVNEGLMSSTLISRKLKRKADQVKSAQTTDDKLDLIADMVSDFSFMFFSKDFIKYIGKMK